MAIKRQIGKGECNINPGIDMGCLVGGNHALQFDKRGLGNWLKFDQLFAKHKAVRPKAKLHTVIHLEYPASGDPALARLIREWVVDVPIALDFEWGLDHGAWSVLCRMFPLADIPVVQLSLDSSKPPAFHYGLGKSLRELRNRGILIVGSGNIVHNLAAVVWKDTAYDWALAFDARIKRLIVSGDHDAIIRYDQFGDAAKASVPTAEHFLPLLYILGLQEAGEEVKFFNEKVTLGAISMTSLQVGGDMQSPNHS